MPPQTVVTTDPDKIDVVQVHEWLKGSYWAAHRTLEKQRRAMSSSLNFGALQDGVLVGFARIVTDGTTFAWLCDVIVDPGHRGQGIGRTLMDAVFTHPDIEGLRVTYLATRDAHKLYAPYGFEPIEPGNVMARRVPEGGTTGS